MHKLTGYQTHSSCHFRATDPVFPVNKRRPAHPPTIEPETRIEIENSATEVLDIEEQSHPPRLLFKIERRKKAPSQLLCLWSFSNILKFKNNLWEQLRARETLWLKHKRQQRPMLCTVGHISYTIILNPRWAFFRILLESTLFGPVFVTWGPFNSKGSERIFWKTFFSGFMHSKSQTHYV